MRHDPRRLDPAAYPWTTVIEPRFGDLDFNRHINNVAVARLYEEGRMRFSAVLRATRPEIGHPRYLVARIEIDYLAEGHYPAPVTIALAVRSFGTTSYANVMALFQADRCIGLAATVLVHRGGDGPAPFPEPLRAALGEYRFRA